MESKTMLAITAILAVTWLETIALCFGINGTILSTTIAVIAGLGGFLLGKKVSNKETSN